jgi:hypothetical protein
MLEQFLEERTIIQEHCSFVGLLAGFCSGDRHMMNTYGKKQTLYGYQQIKQEL